MRFWGAFAALVLALLLAVPASAAIKRPYEATYTCESIAMNGSPSTSGTLKITGSKYRWKKNGNNVLIMPVPQSGSGKFTVKKSRMYASSGPLLASRRPGGSKTKVAAHYAGEFGELIEGDRAETVYGYYAQLFPRKQKSSWNSIQCRYELPEKDEPEPDEPEPEPEYR